MQGVFTKGVLQTGDVFLSVSVLQAQTAISEIISYNATLYSSVFNKIRDTKLQV